MNKRSNSLPRRSMSIMPLFLPHYYASAYFYDNTLISYQYFATKAGICFINHITRDRRRYSENSVNKSPIYHFKVNETTFLKWRTLTKIARNSAQSACLNNIAWSAKSRLFYIIRQRPVATKVFKLSFSNSISVAARL